MNQQCFHSYDKQLGELAGLQELMYDVSARVNAIEGVEIWGLMTTIESLKARDVALEIREENPR